MMEILNVPVKMRNFIKNMIMVQLKMFHKYSFDGSG